jgi:uncharacterized protein (TIGR02453 family)
MFSPKTLSFLRALKRNNDREWFRSRKAEYETYVREPMIEVLARLAVDFRTFAPELVSDPKVSLFRIYRDTRFSNDKTPLKTAVAAHFPSRHFTRNQGAGLYFEVAPGWVWMGGGMYMPSTSDLQAIRNQIATTYPHFHRLVTASTFKKTVGELTGDRLTRVPNGYQKDHPAAHYLQFKQFIGGREYDAALAATPRFYPELLRVFKAVTPLVRFLNSGMLEAATQAPVLVDELPQRDQRRTASLPPVATPMW